MSQCLRSWLHAATLIGTLVAEPSNEVQQPFPIQELRLSWTITMQFRCRTQSSSSTFNTQQGSLCYIISWSGQYNSSGRRLIKLVLILQYYLKKRIITLNHTPVITFYCRIHWYYCKMAGSSPGLDWTTVLAKGYISRQAENETPNNLLNVSKCVSKS